MNINVALLLFFLAMTALLGMSFVKIDQEKEMAIKEAQDAFIDDTWASMNEDENEEKSETTNISGEIPYPDPDKADIPEEPKYNPRADPKLSNKHFIKIVAFATEEVITQFNGTDNFEWGLGNIHETSNALLKFFNSPIAIGNLTFVGVYKPEGYGAVQVVRELNQKGCSLISADRYTLFVLFMDKKTWKEKAWDFPNSEKMNMENGVGSRDPPGALFSGDPTIGAGNPVLTTLFLHEVGHVYGLGHSSNEGDVMFPIAGGKTFVDANRIDKGKKLNTC